jgi:uncharacterized surface protein with fasciclin (FAS1) repeats
MIQLAFESVVILTRRKFKDTPMFQASKKQIFISMLAGAALLTACGNSGQPASDTQIETNEVVAAEVEAGPTIVDLAVGSDDLSTLVAAVTAAGLVDTLNGAGPFTVFAPTNEAFSKLPAGTVETLVRPENKDKLTAILTYHVVGSEVMAADLVQAIKDNGGSYTITTLNGDTLRATIVAGSVVLKDTSGQFSKVIVTDLDASNGVVHLVNNVAIPK